MFPNMSPVKGNNAAKKLRHLFESLNEADQATLLSFAEFLAQRSAAEQPDVPTEPLNIPRPESESVVKAIKRLRTTYPMISPDSLLDQTSSLMASHVLQGRPAEEVIDELEALFQERYQAMTLDTPQN